MLAKKDDLLIMPLGGLEQIGANSTLIGNDKEWIMIDLGISFYDKFGIEVLTPDISFPASIKDKLKGIFVTHAHEDHIGAIRYLWPELKCPVYLTEFPAAVLKQKLSECDFEKDVQINQVSPGTILNVGNFQVEFVKLSHSILGSCGIFVKTKAGSIFHTGDWKIDESPLLGDKVDEERLKEIGKEGVDCLLCDSTNILVESEIGSEKDIKSALKRVIAKYSDKRITVTCFASNVARMETIFSVAKSMGRKVAILGRSMHRMLDAVSETSYFNRDFKNALSAFVEDEEAASMPPSKVLFVCTGSQGEARSALYRLSRGENRVIKFGKNDVVVFSSKVIPGNELDIRDMQNLLVRQGVEIVTTETESDIHVSGHPNKTAIKKMYGWLKPRSFIPIHGDARMLFAHEKFAKECRIDETLIAQSGDIINVSNGHLKKISHKDVVFNALDGSDLIPINSKPIKERATMSYNGVVSVSFELSENNIIQGVPDVVVFGININETMNQKLNSMIYKLISTETMKHSGNIEAIKKESAIAIKSLMQKHFDKKPLVAIHINKKGD